MRNRLLQVTVLAAVGALAAAACSGTGGSAGVGGADAAVEAMPAPAPPSCTNGTKDGSEGDVDCGGTCAAKCADSKQCASAGDCTSGVCTAGVCATATCKDTVKNGAETDADCGGTACPPCADGQACGAQNDCTSGICTTGKCLAASCADTKKNGTETDIDCGGACSACADGKACGAGGDCSSGVCDAGTKKCSAPACTDTVKNGSETDVDCGGTCPNKCAATKGCAAAGDCTSGVCDTAGTKTCLAPACNDSVRNGTETDVDCGGSCSTKCGAGKACLLSADCASGACLASACAALPTTGLAAHYDARNVASLVLGAGNTVTTWADLSGNGRTLTTAAGSPVYSATLIDGKPGINFASSKMTTAAFPLTQDVSVFAAFQYRTPGQWGPIAHHGNRDNDWSMEQSGLKASTVMHWQSVNDNANVELSFVIGNDYVTAGRISGTSGAAVRDFLQSSVAGGTVSVAGTGSSITTGSKVLYVGGSDVNEFSNHYIGELIYYSRAVTDAERTQIVAYLKTRWGF